MFKKYLLLISLFLILSTPIKAFEFKGKFEQGSFILGKTDPVQQWLLIIRKYGLEELSTITDKILNF